MRIGFSMIMIVGFAFGYISGMAGILVSHPFDTIKTHIQSNKPITRYLNGLYRRIGPQLIGVD